MKTVRTVVFSIDVYSPLFFLFVCCVLSFLIVSCFLFLISCLLYAVSLILVSCVIFRYLNALKCIEPLNSNPADVDPELYTFDSNPNRVECYVTNSTTVQFDLNPNMSTTRMNNIFSDDITIHGEVDRRLALLKSGRGSGGESTHSWYLVLVLGTLD